MYPAECILDLAPLNTCENVVELLCNLADLLVVDRVLNILDHKLTDRGNHRRCTAAPSLLECAVLKSCNKLINGEKTLGNLVAKTAKNLDAQIELYLSFVVSKI